MDLAAWVAAGRWQGLLDLIDMLPRDCRLREAQLNDEDFVDALVDAQQEIPPEPWSPAVSEHGLVAELLAGLTSELRLLRSEQAAIASGKTPKPIKPVPPPRTQIQAALDRQNERDAAAILARFGF